MHRVTIGMPELDVDGKAAVDLNEDNRVTSDVLVSLKPALTGAGEAVAIRISTDGDVAGAHVLATVDTFASVDGNIQWQDALQAEADVTLDQLELANFVADWPTGFPVDGDLHIFVAVIDRLVRIAQDGPTADNAECQRRSAAERGIFR